MFKTSLTEADPIIAASISREATRQAEQIELIASENIVSQAVIDAQGSVLTNKYAEGYPGRRYYGGCEYVDEVTLHCRPAGLAFNDPLCLEQRGSLTCDELALMKMLHHMRRDNTPEARDAVNLVTGGYPDAHLIQAGLTLANRFPTGTDRRGDTSRRPLLRVVK